MGALGSHAGNLRQILLEHAGGAPVTLTPSESQALRQIDNDPAATGVISLFERSKIAPTPYVQDANGFDKLTPEQFENLKYAPVTSLRIPTASGPKEIWLDETLLSASHPVLLRPLSIPSVDPTLGEDFLVPVKSTPSTEAAAGFPGEVIDEVIVPVPSELFLVLDKLGKHDWKGELRQGKQPTFTDRTDVALLLGTVVAEGFIAVQAQDAPAVERIGKDVLRLSESLGLKETVLPHTNRILESSKNGHWEIVRVEFDKTQKTVRDTMEQRRDREQSQCVSLGGWLRGTEAVTDLIKQNYTSDAAELLNQPDIVRHFTKVLDKMAGSAGKLVNMRDGLKEIAQVIGAGDEPPAASGVQAIHATTARLVKSITTAKSSK